MSFRKLSNDVTAVVLTIGEPTTQQAIDSLGRQTALVRDVIVVRDLRPFHKALNVGARRVATPFFVQVDADMILDPHCVATLREAMQPHVGIVVGYLRDAIMQRVVGIKLFRTECFAITQFCDSISPDTDFVDEIARAGWQTVYVGRDLGAERSDPATLGEHRPCYTPAYTYQKHLMVGRRYRYRRDVSGLRWHLGQLEQSQHPSAFVAQIALARGFFREASDDDLGRVQNDEEFARLEAFLRADATVQAGAAINLRTEEAVSLDLFRMYFGIGKAMFDTNDLATFHGCMGMLNSQADHPAAWIFKFALCQGLLAATSDGDAIEADYACLSAFTVVAERSGLNDSPPPASGPANREAQHDSDGRLDDIKAYAADIGLRQFVVAPAVGAEYATKRPADKASYCRTTAEVVGVADVKGRPRIKIPFRLFGHIVCTEPERLAGFFWCFDLLKAGYLFAHVPTNLGPHRVLLVGLFARNILARYGWRPRPSIQPNQTRASAFAGITKLRKPRYHREASRVLMVTADLGRGGSERQMLATTSGLVDRSYDVRMLALRRLEPGVPSYEAEIMRLGINPEFAFDSAGCAPASMRPPLGGFGSADCAALPNWFAETIAATSGAIERHRPAVVHGWLDGPGIFAALAGCTLGAPRLVIQLGSTAAIVRSNIEKAELLREAYRALVRNPTVTILNNSKAGARDYEEWLGLRPGTIAVLHNGFIPNSARMPVPEETARFRASLGLSAEMLVVGTVMRFVSEKDPDLWLDTAAEIARSRPDVRFVIAGFGPLEQDIADRIKALGLYGRVSLSGPVTDAGLIYSAMDVVLLTSAIEGLPNVMIEAQAVGRPVVACDVGGTREALVEGRTGVIVGPRSATSLAKAVITMLDQVEWRERVRTEGPEFVARRFGLERMVGETLGHYGFMTGS